LNYVEYLAAVVLDHHEVTVAQYYVTLQLQVFGGAAGLLQKSDHSRATRSARHLGGDVDDRDALQVFELARRLGL
jgi:hypothetical protein